MLAPATMLFRNNMILSVFVAGAALTLAAQQPTSPPSSAPAVGTPAQTAPLTVDRDPVRAPEGTVAPSGTGPVSKQGSGYVLHTEVEEVVLNATVLSGSQIVQNLTKDDFQVF